MKFYILEDYRGNTGVSFIANSMEEAEKEVKRRESLYPDIDFSIEPSATEPPRVNI